MNIRIDVPYLDQSKSAPTGCESVTAVMMLNYLGYPVTIHEFVDRYLDKKPFHEENGRLCGPDPKEAFAGDPYDPESMGCYAPVLMKAMKRIVGNDYSLIDETGSELDDLVERYVVKEGLPIPVWTTIDMKPAIEGPYWYLDGTDELFTWWSNEHCMLLVGADDENYIFNDPWNNNGIVKHPKELVRQRHREQHMQAVGIRK